MIFAISPRRHADSVHPCSLASAREHGWKSAGDSRVKQVFQADIAVHLTPHAVGDAVDDFRAILRWIDMDPERSIAEGQVYDPHDLPCHFCRIGVGWLQAGQAP